MNAVPKQTEARRLADDLGDFANEVELEYCVSDVPNTAALLLRQDELLKQALEALDGMLQIYGVDEKTLPPAASVEIECCDYARQAKSAIRAHREAK